MPVLKLLSLLSCHSDGGNHGIYTFIVFYSSNQNECTPPAKMRIVRRIQHQAAHRAWQPIHVKITMVFDLSQPDNTPRAQSLWDKRAEVPPRRTDGTFFCHPINSFTYTSPATTRLHQSMPSCASLSKPVTPSLVIFLEGRAHYWWGCWSNLRDRQHESTAL